MKHPAVIRARKREEALVAKLADMARAGQSCPTMRELAPMVGYLHPCAVHCALRRLTAEGRVETRRVGNRLIVRIPALALETADPRPAPSTRRPILEIAAIAATTAGLDLADLLGRPNRRKLYTRPRAIAFHFARAEGWSYKKIGKAMERDHSTVIHSARKVEKLLAEDRLFARLYRRTEEALAGVVEKPLPFVPAKPAPVRFEIGDSGEIEPVEVPARHSVDPLLWALQREFPERCAA